MHTGFEPLEIIGPHEIFSVALQNHTTATFPKGAPAYEVAITGSQSPTTGNWNISMNTQIPLSTAYATLADYDVLVIPGGGSRNVLPLKTEPIPLIQQFYSLPKRPDGRVRTLMSICTGSILLAAAGTLADKSATTSRNNFGKLAKMLEGQNATLLPEALFVVNRVDEEKGLRVVTASESTTGIDATFFLLGDQLGDEVMEEAGREVRYAMRDGVVV